MTGFDGLNLHLTDVFGETVLNAGTVFERAGMGVRFEKYDGSGQLKKYQFEMPQLLGLFTDDGNPGGVTDVGNTLNPLYAELLANTYQRSKRIHNVFVDIDGTGNMILTAPPLHYFSRAIITLPEWSGDAESSGEFVIIRHAGFYAFGNSLAGAEPTRDISVNSGCYFPDKPDADVLRIYVRPGQAVNVHAFYFRYPRIWIADVDHPAWTEWRYNSQWLPP